MPHQVFISYSTADKSFADAICSWLEANRIGCWMAPRDITPGIEYGKAIINAINSCKILIVVFTTNANQSRYVQKEVERAISKGAIVIPVRFQDVLPTGSLEFFISAEHWLDAISPPVEAHLDKLVSTIQRLEGVMMRPIASAPKPTDDEHDIKLFNEVAPTEWTRRPRGPLIAYLQRLFDDKS